MPIILRLRERIVAKIVERRIQSLLRRIERYWPVQHSSCKARMHLMTSFARISEFGLSAIKHLTKFLDGTDKELQIIATVLLGWTWESSAIDVLRSRLGCDEVLDRAIKSAIRRLEWHDEEARYETPDFQNGEYVEWRGKFGWIVYFGKVKMLAYHEGDFTRLKLLREISDEVHRVEGN